ncbi:hypothetical protein ACFFX0_24955 [Citricoccus parietis]|uniref:Uncharacterized protein n=1 Tax=Citricoccus parietis TaxID=592307 RepID=A0ABV5G5P8_9MICC
MSGSTPTLPPPKTSPESLSSTRRFPVLPGLPRVSPAWACCRSRDSLKDVASRMSGVVRWSVLSMGWPPGLIGTGGGGGAPHEGGSSGRAKGVAIHVG